MILALTTSLLGILGKLWASERPCFKKMWIIGAGELAQQARMLACLPEDLSSVLSTHTGQFKTTYHSSPKESNILLPFPQACT